MPTLAGSTRPAKSFAPSQQGINTKAPTTLCGGSLLNKESCYYNFFCERLE